jgi:choline kinase
MKLIILSAGKGTRMLPLTKNTPKPLLDLGNGSTVIEEQLDRIAKVKEIKEVVIVGGYRVEQIEAKLKAYQENFPIPIRILFNPFYDISNNFFSLWCAAHEMHSDFMIMNGDNIIDTTAFAKVFQRTVKDGIYITIDRKERYDEDDMKVISEDHLVTRVSKKILVEEATGESIGLAIIKGQNYRRLYLDTIEALARDPPSRNIFWLETFNRLADKGFPIFWVEIHPDEWREIDFKIDYQRAREIMLGPLEHDEKLELKKKVN